MAITVLPAIRVSRLDWMAASISLSSADVGVAQDHARDSDALALALAARELDAALAHMGVVFPTIQVTASMAGASAETMAVSVATPLMGIRRAADSSCKTGRPYAACRRFDLEVPIPVIRLAAQTFLLFACASFRAKCRFQRSALAGPLYHLARWCLTALVPSGTLPGWPR
jgi:hypothetical protein